MSDLRSAATVGVSAEHAVLGAILRDNHQVDRVLGRIRGEEFFTPVLGVIFDGICQAVARGEHVSPYTVSDKFPEWGVHGLSMAEPFGWEAAAEWTADAPVYADVLHTLSIRARAGELLASVAAGLRDTGTEPTALIAKLVTALTDLTSGTTPASERRLLRDILLSEDTYDWVIPAMLERGDRLIVTGNEGGGKTTFLRQLAICTAGGLHPFAKTRTEPKRVLVIDAENSERQWRRTSRWIVNRALQLGCSVNPADAIEIVATKRLDITRPSDLAGLHRHVDEVKPDLLMIGPLYRLYPRAITTDDDAAPVLAALDTLKDRGITLILEAHAGKATDVDGDRMMAPRGSSALLGWPEFGFGLRQLRSDASMSSLVKWRGDRDERAWPEHLYRGGDLPWTPSAV